MAMVMPRSRSSGALSMLKKSRYGAQPLYESTLVIAEVSVVFPWSTWPIVPTLRWGFVRSNFCLAIPVSSLCTQPGLMVAARSRQRGGRGTGIVAAVDGGAHNRTRTGDLAITKGVLYQLSYVGALLAPEAGSVRPNSPQILAVPASGVNSRWWRGQDSNLRSPSGQRFYRPLVLAAHAPLLERWSPRGDSNPLTYRLQIGCATVAPRGPGSSAWGVCPRPQAEGPNKSTPPTSGLRPQYRRAYSDKSSNLE